MAALPGGNANVYARATGWPASLPRALPLLGAALTGGWRGRHDPRADRRSTATPGAPS